MKKRQTLQNVKSDSKTMDRKDLSGLDASQKRSVEKPAYEQSETGIRILGARNREVMVPRQPRLSPVELRNCCPEEDLTREWIETRARITGSTFEEVLYGYIYSSDIEGVIYDWSDARFFYINYLRELCRAVDYRSAMEIVRKHAKGYMLISHTPIKSLFDFMRLQLLVRNAAEVLLSIPGYKLIVDAERKDAMKRRFRDDDGADEWERSRERRSRESIMMFVIARLLPLSMWKVYAQAPADLDVDQVISRFQQWLREIQKQEASSEDSSRNKDDEDDKNGEEGK